MVDIGNRLREARRARGDLDLARCEAATKIRAKYLMALEEERFEVLPEPVFVRGMLRTYAEYLGVDAAPLLEEYARRTHDPVAPPQPTRPGALVAGRVNSKPRRSRGRVIDPRMIALLVGAALVVGGLVWLSGRGRGDDAGSVSTTVPTTPQARTVMIVPTDGTTTVARARLAITGSQPSGGDVIVRESGAQGRLLYEGFLAPGDRKVLGFQGTVWVRVAPGGAVGARLNGDPLPLRAREQGYVVGPAGVIT